MKKKVFLLAVIVIVVGLLLVGCTAKDVKLSKKGHDAILSAAESTYIAIEDGKSYLFNLKNSKKLTKNGYDRLSYIEGDEFDMPNENYLLSYNTGEVGYSIVNSKGEIVLASTSDMKIEYVAIIQEAGIEEEKYYSSDKFLMVYFYNAENVERTAAFKLDGSAIFYDKDSVVEYSKVEGDESNELTYISAKSYETVDLQEKLSRLEVFNSELNSIYVKNFNEDIVYDDDSLYSQLGAVSYKDTSGDSTAYYYDVFVGGKAYTGYDSKTTLFDEDENEIAFIVSKQNGDVEEHSLIGLDGVLRTFANYSKPNYTNNIHIPIEGTSVFDVVNYKGETIASNVEKAASGNFYLSGNIVYNLKGQRLFELADGQTTYTVKYTFDKKEVEVYRVIGTDASIKFFADGMLVKEYGEDFKFDNIVTDIAIFYTENYAGEMDNYYYYNMRTNVETRVKVDEENIIYRQVGSNKYYVEKEDNAITFYSGISAQIVPNNGSQIPAYSVDNSDILEPNVGYGISLSSENGIYYLSVWYDTLTKREIPDAMPVEYVYESANERLYAYYLLDNKGGLIELYSGYNKADVHINLHYEVLVVSTIDKFANESLYNGFSNLEDKTTVFKLIRDKDTKAISLNGISEIAQSNVSIASDKYLLSKDKASLSDRHRVYTYEGELVLEAKYSVRGIQGDLAIVAIADMKDAVLGVYNLAKGKLVEDIAISTGVIVLVSENLYMIPAVGKSGNYYIFKDASGKVIADNCTGSELLEAYGNFEQNTVTYHYAVYLGKNEIKLLSITIDIPKYGIIM